MHEKVYVLVPVYNEEKTLKTLVDRVLDFKELEKEEKKSNEKK